MYADPRKGEERSGLSRGNCSEHDGYYIVDIVHTMWYSALHTVRNGRFAGYGQNSYVKRWMMAEELYNIHLTAPYACSVLYCTYMYHSMSLPWFSVYRICTACTMGGIGVAGKTEGLRWLEK